MLPCPAAVIFILNKFRITGPANYVAGPEYVILDLWVLPDVLVSIERDHTSGVLVTRHSWGLGEKDTETTVRSKEGS